MLALGQVVVAEGAPRHGGQELARLLAEEGLHTTLIPDSAIFAMMARVNKVPPPPCCDCIAGLSFSRITKC